MDDDGMGVQILPQASRLPPEPTDPVHCHPGHFHGVKQLHDEAGHSLCRGAKAKSGWNFRSTPHCLY